MRCLYCCVLRMRGRGFRRESTMRTMQEALEEAERHKDRCESLAALLVVARSRQQQARAEEVERARAAADEAEAAAAAEGAAEAALERLQLEERRAALALEMQQIDAQLGVEAPAP